jgi:hypothetical protein
MEVIGIHQKDVAPLLHDIDAGNLLGFRPALGQRGQQQRRQDHDDRNHHQELDQGETFVISVIISHFVAYASIVRMSQRFSRPPRICPTL